MNQNVIPVLLVVIAALIVALGVVIYMAFVSGKQEVVEVDKVDTYVDRDWEREKLCLQAGGTWLRPIGSTHWCRH